MWNARKLRHLYIYLKLKHTETWMWAFANCRPIAHRKLIAMAGVILQAFSLSLALVCVNGHGDTFCNTKPGVPFDFYYFVLQVHCCHSFQLDHQVDISLYLTEATTLCHYGEVACLKVAWCTFSLIGLLASWLLISISFQVSHTLFMVTTHVLTLLCIDLLFLLDLIGN